MLSEHKVKLKGQPMKHRKLNLPRRKVMTDYQELANTVPSTRRIERTMRRNLHEAAACNVDLQRQRRAQELLAAPKAESKDADSIGAGKSMATTMVASPLPPAQSTIEPVILKTPQQAGNKFKRFICCIAKFSRGRWFLRGSNNRRGRRRRQATSLATR